MSESVAPRHGLERLLAHESLSPAIDAALHITVCTGVRQVNLRGNPQSEAFLNAVSAVLGQELPLVANTTSVGEYRVCWLGPNEWQITAAAGPEDSLVAGLRGALKECPSSVQNVGGGLLTLQLGGAGAYGVLAKGCTLDIARLKAGTCAQSGLGKAGMLIACLDIDEPLFEIVLRRSFADYGLRWLLNAAGEQAVSVTAGEWSAL